MSSKKDAPQQGLPTPPKDMVFGKGSVEQGESGRPYTLVKDGKVMATDHGKTTKTPQERGI